MATRDRPGITSLRSARRFPLNSGCIRLSPVTLPPGRARLATIPLSTGSVTRHDDRHRPRRVPRRLYRRCGGGDQDINFQLNQFERERRETIECALSPPLLNEDLTSLDISEIAKP